MIVGEDIPSLNGVDREQGLDIRHSGCCHCQAIKFEFEAPPDITVYRCNCSICQMTDYLHLILPASSFNLLSGDPSTYTFESHIAKHHFCPACGIKSFYIPRSNPDGVSINFRCVDQSTFTNVEIRDFDGQNWEANASSLSHLSSPGGQ
jgi:hypothetical protein